jgi:hypothetical protein
MTTFTSADAQQQQQQQQQERHQEEEQEGGGGVSFLGVMSYHSQAGQDGEGGEREGEGKGMACVSVWAEWVGGSCMQE